MTEPAVTVPDAPVRGPWVGSVPPRPSKLGGRPTYYLRDLPKRDRKVLAAVVALSLVPVLVSLVVAWMQGWLPIGDIALMALRVGDVFSKHTPLIGQPSSGLKYGGVTSSHPGPIEFWILAPPSVLFGPALGMLIGAVAINGAAIVGVTFVAFRRRGVLFALWSTLGVGLLAFGLHSMFLHDPISSAAATFASVLMVYLMWALIEGDLALLPLAGAVTSYVLLDHLSYLGNWAQFVGAGLVVAAVLFGLRMRRLAAADRRRALWGAAIWVGWTALVVAIIWAPVLYQQLTGNPGNLTVLYQTQSKYSGEPHGWGWALDRARASLGPIPLFLRHFPTTGDPSFLEPASGILGWLALVPLVALIGLGALAWYRRLHAAALLAGVALLAFLSGMYSAASLPVKGAPELKASAMRWMWTAGLIVWIVVLWLAWELFGRKAFARLPKGASRALALTLVGLIAVVALLTSFTASTSPERSSQYFDTFTPAMDQIRSQLEPGGAYLLDYAGGGAGLAQSYLFIGPSIALDLDEHGYDFFLPGPAFASAYGDHRIRQPDTKLTGTITARDQVTKGPDGSRLIGIIPNLTDSTLAQLGPDYPSLRHQVGRSGTVTTTNRGRRLQSGTHRDDTDEAISALLDDPVALLDAGLLNDALTRGYVTAPDLDKDLVASTSDLIAKAKGTTFVGVFLSPPPA